ncbi:MAG TPA: TspO protein [Actinobacteria bacterium]|nr:TspO protein [Actinomycetota bacterium]
MKATITVGGAVAATAVIGGVAADPGSAWYRSLRKPRWQPPPPAYALVWTPLYVTIAYASARALSQALSRDRSQIIRSLLLDLALNAAWTPLFFRARRPRAALAEIACLNIANVLLIRQTWRADRTAAVLLLPYAAWTAFATALNAEIVRLNPGTR